MSLRFSTPRPLRQNRRRKAVLPPPTKPWVSPAQSLRRLRGLRSTTKGKSLRHQRLRARCGSVVWAGHSEPATAQLERKPARRTPAYSFTLETRRGTVAGAVTGDLGYESGTPVAETPAVKTTTGLENVTTPGKRTLGALQLANVAAEGATPLVGPAALEAGAGIEAAPTVGKAVLAAAKSPMVRGLAEGAAAGKATELGTKALGASPEVQQEATSLAQIAPMVAHAAMSSPYEGLRPKEFRVPRPCSATWFTGPAKLFRKNPPLSKPTRRTGPRCRISTPT